MIDEGSPEVLRGLAPYDDIVGRTNRQADDLHAEFAEDLARRTEDYDWAQAQAQEAEREDDRATERLVVESRFTPAAISADDEPAAPERPPSWESSDEDDYFMNQSWLQ